MTSPACGEGEAEPERARPRGAPLAAVVSSDGAFAAPDMRAAAGSRPRYAQDSYSRSLRPCVLVLRQPRRQRRGRGICFEGAGDADGPMDADTRSTSAGGTARGSRVPEALLVRPKGLTLKQQVGWGRGLAAEGAPRVESRVVRAAGQSPGRWLEGDSRWGQSQTGFRACEGAGPSLHTPDVPRHLRVSRPVDKN